MGSEEQDVRIQMYVDARLSESGERARLAAMLSEQLAACGWREEVVLMVRERLRAGPGGSISRDKADVERVAREVTADARRLLPDAVKKELLQRIKLLLQEELHIQQ